MGDEEHSESAEKAAPVALRFDAGKPELDYLLTFPGSVELAFGELRGFGSALNALRNWYTRQEHYFDAVPAAFAAACGAGWVDAFAATCTYGGSKYGIGNYLHGTPIRKSVCCLLRHVRAEIADPGGTDAESGCPHIGHIMWNVLQIGAAIGRPELDDRIRPTTQEQNAARLADSKRYAKIPHTVHAPTGFAEESDTPAAEEKPLAVGDRVLRPVNGGIGKIIQLKDSLARVAFEDKSMGWVRAGALRRL